MCPFEAGSSEEMVYEKDGTLRAALLNKLLCPNLFHRRICLRKHVRSSFPYVFQKRFKLFSEAISGPERAWTFKKASFQLDLI
jgi:hypothetical protein